MNISTRLTLVQMKGRSLNNPCNVSVTNLPWKHGISTRDAVRQFTREQ